MKRECKTPIEQLIAIMQRLRSENGCPWDREQDLESLKQYLVEECYEVLDAIETGDPEQHKEELGDLLLQIVFQSKIREEQGEFAFDDVAEKICEKLIRRHPHVFGDEEVADSAEVLERWHALKAKENKEGSDSVIGRIPRHMPALRRSHLAQVRAARVGFDWEKVDDVVAKVDEELNEVREALASDEGEEAVAEEIGDLLFAVVNLSRFKSHNAEDLLNGAFDKFVTRFKAIECMAVEQGKTLSDFTLEQLEEFWQEAKIGEG